MKRRLFKKWLVLLLPLLAVRALLPTGFMWTADADGLHLVFCSQQGSAFSTALDAPAVEHSDVTVDHSQHHSPADSAHTDHASEAGVAPDAPCPYALAAVAITASAPRLSLDLPPLHDEAVAFRSAFSASAGPIRAERIRGPPHLS